MSTAILNGFSSSSSKSSESKMRALRVEHGDKSPSLKHVNVPELGPNDVLIKTATAILAPDVLALTRAGKLTVLPMTLGHKISGTVERVGGLVDSIQKGQRVRLDPNVSCGTCSYCRTDRDQLCRESGVVGFFSPGNSKLFAQNHDGGIADYVRALSSQVDVLPENVSFDSGAQVHDLANAMRAWKCTNVSPGATLLITAATGAMGAATVKLAPLFGVSKLILVGRSLARLKRVQALTGICCECIGLDKLGDDWVESRGLGRRVTELAPDGVDAIIDFSPRGTDLWQALDGLAVHGTCVVMGGNWSVLQLPMRVIGLNCWRIAGNRNHSRTDSKAILKLLEDGLLDVKDLVTHRFQLDEVDKAISILETRSEQTWMVVINP